ncbi:MAG: hypothetical protein ACI4NA_08970 [Succinivibrio sp.]
MADVLYPVLPRPGLSPSQLVFNRRVAGVQRPHRAKWRGEGSQQGEVEDESLLEEEASRLTAAEKARRGGSLGGTLDEMA